MRQKTGTIRFSFHGYNTEQEVTRILEIASRYKKR
jgi:selenocysteine lyase/cysteine desulfurase